MPNQTADDYVQQMINLQPPGQAFPIEASSNWVTFLTALAQTWARIDANANLLMDEAYPDSTTILLPNWERVAGLPDECSELGDTFQIRRLNLITKLITQGGQRAAYYIATALQAGYVITITEYFPFLVGKGKMGDPVANVAWQSVWQINSPLFSIIWFRANVSCAQDPLASWSNTRLECIMNRIKPAHTFLKFSYT